MFEGTLEELWRLIFDALFMYFGCECCFNVAKIRAVNVSMFLLLSLSSHDICSEDPQSSSAIKLCDILALEDDFCRGLCTGTVSVHDNVNNLISARIS